MQYKHTQIGFPIIISSLVVAILISINLFLDFSDFRFFSFLLLSVSVVCVLSFSILTITIDEKAVILKYGCLDFLKKKFPLEDIKSSCIVKQPWYYGWGIRFTSEGWLFRVGGLYSVRIEVKSGKVFFIGSDEPEKMLRTIR